MLSENELRMKLRQLRTSRGITQKDFAQMVGVSQSAVSQIERGERSATVHYLRAVGEAFDLEAGYFETPPIEYQRSSLNFRRRSMPARMQDRIIFQFGELEREVQSVLQGVPRVDVSLETPIRERALVPGEIEGFAAEIRRRLALPELGPVPNVTRAIERAGIAVVPLKVGDLDLGKFDGVSSPSLGEKNLVISYREHDSGDRHRFTVAHELGHLALHLRFRPRLEAVREEEANLFAGSFLLPEKSMMDVLSPTLKLTGYAEIKRLYGVSIQAIIRRAFTLAVIDKDRYTSLMIQLSSRGWRAKEPVPVGMEKPMLLDLLKEERKSNVIPFPRRG